MRSPLLGFAILVLLTALVWMGFVARLVGFLLALPRAELVLEMVEEPRLVDPYTDHPRLLHEGLVTNREEQVALVLGSEGPEGRQAALQLFNAKGETLHLDRNQGERDLVWLEMKPGESLPARGRTSHFLPTGALQVRVGYEDERHRTVAAWSGPGSHPLLRFCAGRVREGSEGEASLLCEYLPRIE